MGASGGLKGHLLAAKNADEFRNVIDRRLRGADLGEPYEFLQRRPEDRLLEIYDEFLKGDSDRAVFFDMAVRSLVREHFDAVVQSLRLSVDDEYAKQIERELENDRGHELSANLLYATRLRLAAHVAHII